MVDWVSLSISLVALIVSSGIALISLRLAWKSSQFSYNPYLGIKIDNKKLVIRNIGQGIVYNLYIGFDFFDETRRLLHPMIPYIEPLQEEILSFENEITFLISEREAYEISEIDKLDKIPIKIENIKEINIRCENAHHKKIKFIFSINYDKILGEKKYTVMPLSKNKFRRKKYSTIQLFEVIKD